METDCPVLIEVIQSLLSVFLIRNSQVAGTGVDSGPAAASASSSDFFFPGGVGLGGVPVGALAIAKKIGLMSESCFS